MNLGLGIDTGGTYTDSVIIDFDSGRVLAKAKALTTRYDLSVGIANSIDNLGEFDASKIKLVSASTTLATNSIVEGKGARACLIGIGYDKDTLYNYGLGDSFPIKEVRLINGGHDIQGHEIKPLDIESLQKSILETKGVVDAYGISAYGGVRNPSHEIKAREMVKELAGLPVICGHELTSSLNSIRRAITVAFNARLVPVIKELLTSIKDVLHDRGIKAPLMVVKGDGHIVSDEFAMERPVETILSGPAASITGASYLSSAKTGIVVDMGGTTTDIAIIRDGIPDVRLEGAMVGGWRTSIRAADIHTSGLGGDSHITIDRSGKINLTPKRVIPLSLASANYEEMIDELERLAQREWTTYLVGPTDFLIRMKEANHYALSDNEKAILDMLGDRPKSSYSLSVDLDLLHPALLNTTSLEEHGILARIGLTPTDILHAEGTYSKWNSESARIASEIYARHLGIGYKEFISYMKEKVIDKLSTEILSKIIADEIDTDVNFDSKLCSILLEKILGKSIVPNLELKTSVKIPIIAIGAPVSSYFPKVASQLGAELIIPEHAEVANAIGAITGSIIETVDILIDPIYSPAGLVCYTVHTPIDKVDFKDLPSAVAYAEKVAGNLARERAIQAGAGKQLDVRIQRTDETATPAEGYGNTDFLLSSHIKATAIGKPDIIEQ
ncbi:TPA: hydantoinase/oxoprolinase family protein [Candidatus Poribacteria bacterium]|nr:hydantoinase/oxoprolinase family protein [Candidatus Poribacteria bacterium]